ncbi:SesB protein [Lojkania enalia]|uniref:SesB protein n=1 Tax=Lojkania enalia TaxID=147567 RepID=A0A9P4KC60_9PLEO|nr:SesB protein [Didymosphaeria enalia]
MAPKISPDDLNLLYDGGNESVVDIVFVHGLRGHPRKTWEAQDPENPDELVFWPQDLLPETIKNSRIFSFGYATQFVTFYGINTEPINHTSIDHHSASLILKFGNVRRDTQTPTRPIIFVAHSLGGLVVANSLVGKYGTDAQGQEVINHTYGTVFFGTPFKSSDKAPVAEIARKVLKMFGDTNDQTIRDLDKRSEKLQKISNDFHSLLEERLSSNDLKPIQVACFFEEIKTTRTFFKVFEKDLGHIVTADSATLAGCKQFGINATHQMMCRFSNVENAGYKLVTGKIKEMISNFNKSKAQLKVSYIWTYSRNIQYLAAHITSGRRKDSDHR